MAGSGRSRPSYKPDADLIRQERERSGLSIVDFAAECKIGEKTLLKVLAGEAVDFATLDKLAAKLKINHWHELLAVEERAKLAPVSSAPPPPGPPLVVNRLAQLPAVVADFTGRADEARRMAALLRGDGGRGGVSALRGMGGVGKTSLAVKVAHEVRDRFPDAQLVVDLRGTSDQPMTAAEAMARVVRDFHPEQGKLPDAAADLLPLYRSVLAGKRVLIVLDNAKDEDQVQLLVTAPPPAGFIVTSRAALALDGVEAVRLDVLPPAEALALLRGIVGPKETDAELRAVADLCGRLPLALRVAGDFLRLHPNWSVPRYIAALADEAQRLERLKGKAKDKDVEAVLSLSAAELVKANPEQAERWQMLSVFPADFNAVAVAVVWDLKTGDEPDTDMAVDELTAFLDRSLIEYDEPTDRYSLHDLMRPIARDSFAGDHPRQAGTADRLRGAERRFARHYCEVLAAANDLYLKGHDDVLKGLALYDWEAANIQAGWNWPREKRTIDLRATELSRDCPNKGAHVLSLRLPARTQIVWLEGSVEACRRLGDRRGEGAALGNLGNAHRDLGDARAAITFYEQRLVIAREIGDRRGEGNALGSLGSTHYSLGDTRAAITFYEQRLVIAREIGDRHGETNANWNMAIVLRYLGRHREAIPFAEQSLAFFESIGHSCVEEDRQTLARWRAEAEAAESG
ncbi:tetratricopeptide repeat protein [bacterium]|nr:tetratricopeptide repeat protein [bacterium]